MKIVKYNDFLSENSNITETEILEFLKEKWNTAHNEIMLETVSKFPIDTKNITDEQQNTINDCLNTLIKISKDIIIDNNSTMKKNWLSHEDKIELGDSVKDGNGEKYFVSKFGSNNDFYDNEKRDYFTLSDKKKV